MSAQPEVDVIADSISPDGIRLTTFQVQTWRYILAEFNTHRVFSRNSASSRAIPLRKQIDRIKDGVAYPSVWPTEQKGMQGGEALSNQAQIEAREIWQSAAEEAISSASDLQFLGSDVDEKVHKSVVNRLLEPFMWHTIVVTATAWENFFNQRCSPMAQPEIRVTAELMRAAMAASEPRPLKTGQWHLPYVQADELATIEGEDNWDWSGWAKISAARCARVSYLTQDGQRDITKDLDLYNRLVTRAIDSNDPRHWSPLEHVATPWWENHQEKVAFFRHGPRQTNYAVPTGHLPKVGNLYKWRSLRTEVEFFNEEITYK